MMKSRFRPIVLPGGRAAGAPSRPRLTRASLRVLRGSSDEASRALNEAVAAARRMRQETEQRRARLLDATPEDSR